MDDFQKLSLAYSFIGHKCESEGDVSSIKFLYTGIPFERSPHIKAVSLLQERLTDVEISKDIENRYSKEFLYCYGMLNIGEESRLIVKNLDTARFCLKKVSGEIPKVEARLAYIDLLLSTEIHKSEATVRRIGILRKWAGQGDLFSRIVLAKIIFESFLSEDVNGISCLPLQAIKMLEDPCKKGHPVAINFYNSMISYISDGELYGGYSRNMDESDFNTDILYDL